MVHCYKHIIQSMECVRQLVGGSSDTSFQLNEHQCQILAKELAETNAFFKKKSACSKFGEGVECIILQHLCSTIKKAEVLVKKCCCKDLESWLISAIMLVEIQEEFMAIILDIHLWRMLLDFAITCGRGLSQEKKVEEIKIMDEEYHQLFEGLRRESRALRQAAMEDKKTIISRTSRIVDLHGSTSGLVYLQAIYLQSWLTSNATCKNVELTTYEFVNVLGQGGCGMVLKVRWLGIECALKVLPGQDEKEAIALKGLFHPNIIRLFHYWEDCPENPRSHLLMELMPQDLDVYMRGLLKSMSSLKMQMGEDSVPFSIPVAIDIMYQIAQAMHYMHDKHLTHRDLKPANILVKEWSRVDSSCLDGAMYLDVKLADFGLVKSYTNTSTFQIHSRNKGTGMYRAPEILEKDMAKKQHYLPMADVWSFGITCAEILSGKQAYAEYIDKSALDIQTMICKEGLRPTLPKHCPEYLAFCIKSCWEFLPSQHPRFASICKLLRHAQLLSLGVTKLEDSKFFFAYTTRSDQVQSLSVSPSSSKAKISTFLQSSLKFMRIGPRPVPYAAQVLPAAALMHNEPVVSTPIVTEDSPQLNEDIGGGIATLSWTQSTTLPKPSPRVDLEVIRRYTASSSSSREDRNNASREADGYQFRAPPPGSYQDDDTEPFPKNLVMAITGVKSAVNHFAKVLITNMNKHPVELEYLKQTILPEVSADVDRANHWKFLVQAFMCKRFFDGFNAPNGYFGVEYFENDQMTKLISFTDFSKFKDKASTISMLLDSDSPDDSFLGRFCFKKFKSITGDLASNQPLPIYQEEWDAIERERHPKTVFYQSFLKVAVSVWLVHRLVHSFEEKVEMLIYANGAKFQRQTMESVVPGRYEEEDEEADVNTEVGFSVIPGFQVSRSVVKCEVYLRSRNRHTDMEITGRTSTEKTPVKTPSNKPPGKTLSGKPSVKPHTPELPVGDNNGPKSLQPSDGSSSSSHYVDHYPTRVGDARSSVFVAREELMFWDTQQEGLIPGNQRSVSQCDRKNKYGQDNFSETFSGSAVLPVADILHEERVVSTSMVTEENQLANGDIAGSIATLANPTHLVKSLPDLQEPEQLAQASLDNEIPPLDASDPIQPEIIPLSGRISMSKTRLPTMCGTGEGAVVNLSGNHPKRNPDRKNKKPIRLFSHIQDWLEGKSSEQELPKFRKAASASNSPAAVSWNQSITLPKPSPPVDLEVIRRYTASSSSSRGDRNNGSREADGYQSRS